MKERMIKPKETIYCLLYEKPHKVEYLCQEIYGKKRNSRISKWIKELLKEKYIKRIENFDDRRYDIYYANPKYLYMFIKQCIHELSINPIKLTNNENKALMKLIESKPFKGFVYVEIGTQAVFNRGGVEPFQLIKSGISDYCVYLRSIATAIGNHPFSNVLKCGDEQLEHADYLSMAFIEANPTFRLVNILSRLDRRSIDLLHYLEVISLSHELKLKYQRKNNHKSVKTDDRGLS